ncbi:hypothetical protein BTEBP_20109 [Brochothrix thermosphacta]|nr:hypothetical protein BTEBP_20109 [Brochothrix thermosphacta]
MLSKKRSAMHHISSDFLTHPLALGGLPPSIEITQNTTLIRTDYVVIKAYC